MGWSVGVGACEECYLLVAVERVRSRKVEANIRGLFTAFTYDPGLAVVTLLGDREMERKTKREETERPRKATKKGT